MATAVAAGTSEPVLPTVQHAPPPIAALEADGTLFVATNLRTLRNTLLGDVLDWSGLSISTGGFDAEELPTGFFLSGALGDDSPLLKIGEATELLIRAAMDVQPPGAAGWREEQQRGKD